MNLVIVESPTKAKTIEKFLGKDFEVVASFGHVRDLPHSEIGIDIKNNFEPNYVIVPKASKILKNIKAKVKQADALYLATDYDREGEAIAWHLLQAIGLKKLKTNRITFHEITKDAITEAIKHPRDIDIRLVDAQQARRILDRLVGYKLSPFLWRKVAQGLSAGRVQSVAVRLIVEKEREIRKFKSQEYWSVEALLKKGSGQLKAILTEKDGKRLDKLAINSEKEAKEILEKLKNADYLVKNVKKEVKKRYPAPPFTTSTLQQEAGNKLGMSAKQTMRLAQGLYEKGLITYMRTDSVSVASIAQKDAKKTIEQQFGKDYTLDTPRFFKTKSKGAQEAHEAIRPTNLKLLPEKATLDASELRLYSLIWKRMIASQMKDAEMLEENVKISADNFTFTANGLKVQFDGFLKVYNKVETKENTLPELKIGDKLDLEKIEKLQHFTEPPARFTEASLIKELEKKGIGRPSTYAPTLSTIIDRGYVEKNEGKLSPKEIGEVVNDVLVEHFPEVVDYDFTARMEEELDEIAEGKLKWEKAINDFYEPFSNNLKTKTKEVEKKDLSEESDEDCPKCGKKLKIKLGRFGKFLACSSFPECKFTKPLGQIGISDEKKAQLAEEKCPKCGKEMTFKEGKFGQFLACSGYPECKTTKNIEIVAAAPCPNCGGKLLRKNTRKRKVFWGCGNYPKCKTAFWEEPTDQKCQKCGSIILKDRNGKLKCSQCDVKEKKVLKSKK
ncbi:MAG: type I DNA topoisomerase [Patescibacteria group bacterium]